jgi:hypothetical protein
LGRWIVGAGASCGIGSGVVAHYATLRKEVVVLSRSAPPAGRWVRVDLSSRLAIVDAVAAIGSNPGYVAADAVRDDIAAGRFPDQTAIPMAGLPAVFDFALSLSTASVAREIDLAQMRDR